MSSENKSESNYQRINKIFEKLLKKTLKPYNNNAVKNKIV